MEEFTTLHWDEYIERTARIRMLSSPLIDDSMSASDYYDQLIQNFSEIRELSALNRELLAKEIYPILRSEGGPLSEEQVEQLREFEQELLDGYNMENLDSSLMASLAERLHRDALRKGNKSYIIEQLDAKMTVYYAIMNMMGRSSKNQELCSEYREKAKEAGRQICSYLEPTKFESLDEQTRAVVMVDARYISGMYDRELGEEAKREALDYIHKAEALADNPFYKKMLPNFDWDYHLMRVYEYAGMMLEFGNEKQMTKEEAEYAYESVEKLYALWKEHDHLHGKVTEAEVLMNLYRAKYFAEKCDKEEYKKKLLEVYKMRSKTDYTISDVYINILLPIEYDLLLGDDRFHEEETEHLEEFYHQIVSYIMRMPNSGCLSWLLEYAYEFQESFNGITGGDNYEDMCLNCMATLHPPTYVHSLMVAKLSRCFTVYLLEKHPEMFLRTLDGCDTVEQVIENKRAIIDFAYHSAICHDLGKMPLVDTIFIYGRNLTEEEFKLIKSHPDIGASSLKGRHLMSEYADVARGHHKWYDNSAGYPAEFDTRTSRYKIFIDIISMADCMDAATDSVGRSYHSCKTLDMFLQEVNQVCGTRYAPFFQEMFEDEKLIEELRFLMDSGRKRVYYDTFMRLKDLQQRADVTK